MKNNKMETNLNTIGLILIDLILVLSSIYLSYMIKFNFKPPKFNYEPFLETLPFTVIIYFVFMYIYGLVDVLKKSLGELIYSIFITVFMLFICTTAIAFFSRGFSYPRSIIITSAVFQFVLLSIWRTIAWKFDRKIHGKKTVLLLGDSNSEHMAKKILLTQNEFYDIKYMCDSNCENIQKYMDDVQLVIIGDDIDAAFKDHVLDLCLTKQKELFLIPTMSEMALFNSKLHQVDDIPLLEVKSLGLTIEQKFVKRFLDLMVSAIGLVIASPIMVIVAVIIKITDGGSILYSQKRITENERVFNVYKFRSMMVNAEKMTGPILATENDPRITKIGRIMRATRIDELPQLFNILRGDMSIVGPRPERPFYVEKFKNEILDYKYRTSVKAGLTGLAQVFGKYNTTAEDKVRYDIMYIKNYSIWKDFIIILQTIKIIFMKESTAAVSNHEISLDEIIDEMNVNIKIDKKE
jgi:exopolysaccharide biosynthesis polyprenyl glycosylphosphotransferase